MSFVIKGSNFEPAPAGPTAAVCIDLVDLGMREGQYGLRRKLKIVWSLEKRMKAPDRKSLGKPYIAQKVYGWSLHPKSLLRQDIEAWTGKKLTEKQIREGVDLEKLIGRAAFLSIQHNERDGAVFANVVAIMPLPDGMHAPLPDPDYVRVKDRSNGSQAPSREDAPDDAPPPSDDYAPAEDDENIPF